MNTSISVIPLGIAARTITSGTTPSALGFKYTNRGISFINADSIRYDGSLDPDFFLHIDHEAHQRFGRSAIQTGDILLALSGNKSAIVRREHEPANINSTVILIRTNPEIVLPEFLKHYLHMARKCVPGFLPTSTKKGHKLSVAGVRAQKIEVIPLSLQENIVREFRALEDEIDTDFQRIGFFEAEFRMVFERCFGALSSPSAILSASVAERLKGQLGWRLGKLQDVVHRVRNVAIRETANTSEEIPLMDHSRRMWTPMARLRGVDNVELEQSDHSLAVLPGDVIIGRTKRDFVEISKAYRSFCVSADTLVLRPKSLELGPLFLGVITSDAFTRFVSYANAGRNGRKPTWELIRNYQFLIPNPELLGSVNGELISKISSCSELARSVGKARIEFEKFAARRFHSELGWPLRETAHQ